MKIVMSNFSLKSKNLENSLKYTQLKKLVQIVITSYFIEIWIYQFKYDISWQNTFCDKSIFLDR